MRLSEVQIDLKDLIDAFNHNEIVKHNIESIVMDFEMMHANVSFEENTSMEEMKQTKISQLGSFICGVICASSPMSEFQRNIKLPESHSYKKKEESNEFARSLGI